MSRQLSVIAACCAGILLFATVPMANGQTNQTEATAWLAKANLAPPFAAPSSREAWLVQRQEIRARLWVLLGQLPPRP